MPNISVVLPLSQIDELFTAPDANPFSAYEVDVLGESGLSCIEKQLARRWPRRPDSLHVTVQLPAEQITPELEPATNTAIHRYCSDRIASNRLKRGLVMQRAQRQFLGAIIGTFVALLVITLLSMNPFGLIPEALRDVLILLAAFAIAVLIFDALWSLIFDWLPFVQDNTVYTIMKDMHLRIEPQPIEKHS